MRSHVDPCSFVVYVHIEGKRLDADLVSELRSYAFKQGESPQPILSRLPFRTHQIRFHEDYHFWQGLRLPFLYRYAMLSFHHAMQVFRQLALTEKDYTKWDCQLPNLERLGLALRIGRFSSHLVCGGDGAAFPQEVEEEIRLSPMDLLECATSLAEFQVTSEGDKSDPRVLQRWAKRNPATLEPFWFAASFLCNPSLALRCILPLINATFHTSEPVRTFVELLARMWGSFVGSSDSAQAFLAQPEPCRWPELFAVWLDELPYEAAPNVDSRLLGSPYHRIDLEQWVFGSLKSPDGGAMIHPLLGVTARAWLEAQKALPEMGMLMDQPAWVRDETFWSVRNEFSPPLTVYHIHFDIGYAMTFLAGREDRRGFTSMMDDPTQWRGFLADFLTMYGVVRRASGAHFDAQQRTCHHVECPHYEQNYCNSYLIIPAEYSSCGFPARISNLIQRFGAQNG
jgi:hypothetical protein